jgi:hypothetical protein
MGQKADNHIYQFVASWFGFEDETDFDTRLYRCMAIFRPLSADMFKELSSNMALPLYVIYICVQVAFISMTILWKWNKAKLEPAVHSSGLTRERKGQKNS